MPLTVLNYDAIVENGEDDIVKRLIRSVVSVDVDCDICSRWVNKTPSHPLAHVAITGVVAKLESLVQSQHVNSFEIDKIRGRMAKEILGKHNNYSVMVEYDEIVYQTISNYINKSVEEMPEDIGNLLHHLGNCNVVGNKED